MSESSNYLDQRVPPLDTKESTNEISSSSTHNLIQKFNIPKYKSPPTKAPPPIKAPPSIKAPPKAVSQFPSKSHSLLSQELVPIDQDTSRSYLSHSISKKTPISVKILYDYLHNVKDKLRTKLSSKISTLDVPLDPIDMKSSLTECVLKQQLNNMKWRMSDDERIKYKKLYTYYTSDTQTDDFDVDKHALTTYVKHYKYCLAYSILSNNNEVTDSMIDFISNMFGSDIVSYDCNIKIRNSITVKVKTNQLFYELEYTLYESNIDEITVPPDISSKISIPSRTYFELMKTKIFQTIKDKSKDENIIKVLSSFTIDEDINYHYSIQKSVNISIEVIVEKLYQAVSCYKGTTLSLEVSFNGDVDFSINLQEEVLSCTKKYVFIEITIYITADFDSAHAILCVVEKTPERRIYIYDPVCLYRKYDELTLILNSLFPEFIIVLITQTKPLQYKVGPYDPDGYCATLSMLARYTLCSAYTYSDSSIKDNEDFTLYVFTLFTSMLKKLSSDEFTTLIRNFLTVVHQYGNKCFVKYLNKYRSGIVIPPTCLSNVTNIEEFKIFKDNEVKFFLQNEELMISIGEARHNIDSLPDSSLVKKFAKHVYMCYTNNLNYVTCMYELLSDYINGDKKSKLHKYDNESTYNELKTTYNN